MSTRTRVVASTGTLMLVFVSAICADDSLHVLIDLVSDRSPDALSRAETLYAELTKEGVVNAHAAYALALLRTREQKYNDAARLLNTLPNQEKYALRVLRLRLWLALERGEQQLAERLVAMLREQIRSSMLKEADRVEAAHLLGGIVGALAEPEGAVLPKELLEVTVKELTAPGDQRTSFEFRQAQQAALKRRQELSSLVTEAVNDRPAAATRLSEMESEQANLDKAIKASEATLTETIRANRTENQKLSAHVRKLTASAAALRREASLETPGKPAIPSKPSGPTGSIVEKRTPTLPSKLDGGETRSLSPTEQREYDQKLRAYEQALRDYPAKLAEWNVKNEVRRADLNNQMAALNKELMEARAEDKTRSEQADKIRDNIAGQQNQARDLEIKIRLNKAAVAAGIAADPVRVLQQPSSYDLISYSTERQRLLQATRQRKLALSRGAFPAI